MLERVHANELEAFEGKSGYCWHRSRPVITNADFEQIHAKIMLTCTMFASYTSNLSRALASADPTLANPTKLTDATQGVPSMSSEEKTKLDKLGDNLQKYDENFGRHLKILLDALNYYAAT